MNHEWDGPYTGWGVDSDECDCSDCCIPKPDPDLRSMVYHPRPPVPGGTFYIGKGAPVHFGFWLTYYKLRKRLADALPRFGR